MEMYGDSTDYPPIRAQIALGSEDLTVKVSLLSQWGFNQPLRRHSGGPK